MRTLLLFIVLLLGCEKPPPPITGKLRVEAAYGNNSMITYVLKDIDGQKYMGMRHIWTGNVKLYEQFIVGDEVDASKFYSLEKVVNEN